MKTGEIVDLSPKKKINAASIIVALMFVGVAVASFFFFQEPEEVIIETPPVYCEGEYRAYICSFDWEDKIAISIVICESSEDPNALGYNDNGTVDFSLFQLNSTHLGDYSLLELADPFKNIETAYKIWDKGDGVEGNGAGDWRPWVAFTNGCWYDYYIQLGVMDAQ